MFTLEDTLKFINIDQDYLKSLHDACPEVYYKPFGYESKPYVGILINANDRRYVIPLTSAKEKHKSWKNTGRDCFLIYEYADSSELGTRDIWVDEHRDDGLVKHILAAADVKKMIPLADGSFSYVNINPTEEDSDSQRKYKDLLNKEYNFCRIIIDDIIRVADKLYDKQLNHNTIPRFSCDFKKLEAVCDLMEVQ